MDRRKGYFIGWRRILPALVFCGFALNSCDKLLVKEDPPPPPPEVVAVPPGLEALTEPVTIEMPDPNAPPPFVLDTRSQVSLLCYHDFSTSNSTNPMKINIEKFRQQMQALKDNEIPVISMSDFMKWKRGEINIPDFCVLITIDDGWREVHSMAYPVMKEFGYPFTLFIYTKYLNIGGRSLTFDQINEMIADGAEIGSHSVSHLDMTSRHGLSEEGYEEFLVRELKESRDELKKHFGEKMLDVFSYPYGTYSARMIELATKLGYEVLVTVNGKKTAWNDANAEIGRYIIHGNNDGNFKYALTIRGNTSLASAGNLLAPPKDGEEVLVTTSPAADETIADRLPMITVDLSKLEGIDPKSIEMTVSGFGTVPASYDGTTRMLTFQIPQRLRDRVCDVRVTLKRAAEAGPDTVAWTFFLAQVPHYLPPEEEKADADADADADVDTDTDTGAKAESAQAGGWPERAGVAVE